MKTRSLIYLIFLKIETNSGKAISEVDLIDKSISGVIIVFYG